MHRYLILALLAGCATPDFRDKASEAAFEASATCYVETMQSGPAQEARVFVCEKSVTRYGVFRVERWPRCTDMRVYCDG